MLTFKTFKYMKKGLFFASVLFSLPVMAQTYVHQVLVANEGYFDFQTNAIIEPATIGSYNPATQQYQVVDTLEGMRFSSDIVIDGDFYYVAADTKIFKMDLNTHQEISSVSCPGVRNLAIANNQLIATRGEYQQVYDSYLHVYDKTDLHLIQAIDTVQGPKWATQNLVVVGAIAYIAVNNGYDWGHEKGLIGQLNLSTLQYGSEIDLGAEGKNPDNLFFFNNALYTVNNKDWTGSSVSKIELNGSVQTSTIASAVTGCGTSALRDDKLVYQLSMETTLNDFDLSLMNNVGPIASIQQNFYELAQNPVSGELYASSTDFFSSGLVQLFDASNSQVGQFTAGVSPGTIVFDVRQSNGLSTQITGISISPNPATDLIQVSGLEPGQEIYIYSLNGVCLLKSKENTLNLNALSSGAYLLKAGNFSQRILKN
ncbi:MAG: hypothetical protein RLZZ301_249 [Bacteroidota bacterium]|jgi:hypothetical protein